MLKIPKFAYYFRYGLGDRWASVSFLLKESERLGRPIFVNTDCNEGHIQELASYFETTGRIIYDKNLPIVECDYLKCFLTKYLPTKKTWRETNSKIIAYQFDGVSSFWNKNPPDEQIAEFLNYLSCRGFTPVDVGHMRPIPYIIDVLSTCKFFVGCSSGIGHISMSVNAPMYIILQNLPDNDEAPYGAQYQKKIYSSKSDVQFFKYLKDLMNHLG